VGYKVNGPDIDGERYADLEEALCAIVGATIVD
jgi:hypothetical protein